MIFQHMCYILSKCTNQSTLYEQYIYNYLFVIVKMCKIKNRKSVTKTCVRDKMSRIVMKTKRNVTKMLRFCTPDMCKNATNCKKKCKFENRKSVIKTCVHGKMSQNVMKTKRNGTKTLHFFTYDVLVKRHGKSTILQLYTDLL